MLQEQGNQLNTVTHTEKLENHLRHLLAIGLNTPAEITKTKLTACWKFQTAEVLFEISKIHFLHNGNRITDITRKKERLLFLNLVTIP